MKITYIAVREIEPAGYTKTGTDISAAASDDSFNSVTTDLSGLLNNQWALVSGFVNTSNNGWFQANGNSTSTKITQDTTTSLITEAAGAIISIVGYKRGFGQSYDLEFYSEKAERLVKLDRNVHKPIGGGAAEVLFMHQDVLVDVSAIGANGEGITEAQIPQYREFLASVSAGEIFTFDRYGTIAVPVDPRSAQLENGDYSEELIVGGSDKRYKISFSVRLVN